MNNNNEIISVSEFGFIRLWSAFISSYNLPLIINQNDLQNKLYEYKDDLSYASLFNDINFIENEYNCYADLDHGLSFAKNMGILEYNEEDDIYYVMLDVDSSNEILCSYNSDVLNSMHDLFDSVMLSKEVKQKVK